MNAADASRVVLDTNVIVSALVFRSRLCSPFVSLWQSVAFRPLSCDRTAGELLRVLTYPKLGLNAAEQLEALAAYLPYCDEVAINGSFPVQCRDPKDQIFLDLAESGRAEVLVTGDADLLALAGQAPFAIETPADFRLRFDRR